VEDFQSVEGPHAQAGSAAPASWPVGDGTGQGGGERREKMMGLMCRKQKQRGLGENGAKTHSF
jgi:hypothetical protein